MNKRITVTLTEDQHRYVLGLVMVDQFELTDSLKTAPNKEMFKKSLAFTKRTKKDLVKAKVNVT